MSGSTSSNDLLLEQLRELIATRQHELNEGITPRALSRQLEAADERLNEFDERLRELEAALSKQTGVMETGRFHVPAVTVPISKRPSKPSWVEEVTKKPAMIVLIALATILAHAILKLLH